MGRASTAYQQLWHVVSGAVADAFNRHPNYLTKSGQKYARASIVKRVTGTVLSFAVQATAESRVTTAERATGELSVSVPEADAAADGVRLHSHAYVEDRIYHAIRRALFPSTTRELRRDAKRFRIRFKAKTSQLRAELQCQSNQTLSEAIEDIRGRVG